MEKEQSVFQNPEILGKAAAIVLAHSYSSMPHQVVSKQAFRKHIGNVFRPLEELLGRATGLEVKANAENYDSVGIVDWLTYERDRLGVAAAVQGMVRDGKVEELGGAVHAAYLDYRSACEQKGRQHDYLEFFKHLCTQFAAKGYEVNNQIVVPG